MKNVPHINTSASLFDVSQFTSTSIRLCFHRTNAIILKLSFMGILWHMKTIQITFIHVNGADIHKRTIQQWHSRRFLTIIVKNQPFFHHLDIDSFLYLLDQVILTGCVGLLKYLICATNKKQKFNKGTNLFKTQDKSGLYKVEH